MNHAFVITKGPISEKRLDTLLREIVRERWGDLVLRSRGEFGGTRLHRVHIKTRARRGWKHEARPLPNKVKDGPQ